MTNIWADSYKEIRKPFFDTESLEEERAKRDYDGDGQIESGAKEYRGAVHNEIQKKKGGKPDGQDTSSVKESEDRSRKGTDFQGRDYGGTPEEHESQKRSSQAWASLQGGSSKKEKIQKEDVEQVDENRAMARDPEGSQRRKTYSKQPDPSKPGFTGIGNMSIDQIAKMSAKIKKEKTQKEDYVNEAQVANRNPEKYEREQDKKYAPVRGEKRPMPPRGHKDREAFERWYRANVREETLVEVEKKNDSKDKKIDVMSGKNKSERSYKIVINPQIKEEVEEWVAELVEEGYDLSEFTWDEMTDIYVDEMSEGTADMPPRGDAETVSVTNPQLASAKRRAAQAQITADMARIKLQKASAMTKESFDSIVEYLSQRNDAFENLEEAVFDPKRTRMRPASERTQRVMTPAQRTAAEKEARRVAAIHSKGETVLAGLRPQGKRGKVKTTPDAKPAAPEANRTVRGRYDKLAKAATSVLKSAQR